METPHKTNSTPEERFAAFSKKFKELQSKEPKKNSVLEAARKYVAAGYSIVPIKKGEKYPSIHGEHMAWKETYKLTDRLPTENELVQWFENTDNQIGIITGRVSGGLFILDFDDNKATHTNDWECAFNGFLQSFPEFNNSLIVRTGSGKRHIYGKCPEMPKDIGIKIKKFFNDGQVVAKIEFRANDAQSLCPPSIHPCGGRYSRIDDPNGTKEPIIISLSRLNEILAVVNEVPEAKDDDKDKKPKEWHERILQGVDEGERHLSMISLAARVVGKKLSKAEAMAILLDANSKFNPPLDEEEVEQMYENRLEKDERKKRPKEAPKQTSQTIVGGAPQPQTEPGLTEEEISDLIFKDFSDTENARRFLKFNPDTFLWIEDQKEWWYFDSKKPGWGNGEMAVRTSMKDTAEKITRIILQAEIDDAARIGKLKQCVAWKDTNGIEGAIKMLRDWGYAQSTEFDTDPFLFLCKNGVINLKTDGLSSFKWSERIQNSNTLKPSDRLHKMSPVVFNPDATCPQWEQFLIDIFLGNTELIHFIQKFCGYTLTGNTREQKFLMLEGRGSNGKSTLLEVIAGIMGEYEVPVPFATFKDAKWDQGGNAHQADIVQLIGARFVRSIEVKERAKLNIERLKSLTGNEKMSARPPHARHYINFYPEGKIWLAVNQLPKIYDTTNSCWRRLLRIPFSYTVPPEKEIKDYHKKLLQEESSGILNWMLAGCFVWQEEGLNPIPSVVLTATDEYMTDSNPIKRFIDENCERGRFEVSMKDFYEALQKWWKEEMGDINPMSKIEVGKELQRRDFVPRLIKNTRYYRGLRLKSLSDLDDPS